MKEKEKMPQGFFLDCPFKSSCLVSSRFLDEKEIAEMLRKKGNRQDAEWYLEDMESWGTEDESDFKVDDILKICIDRFSKRLESEKIFCTVFMSFAYDCHGITFRLVCDKCWEKLMAKGYDGEFYDESDENIDYEY